MSWNNLWCGFGRLWWDLLTTIKNLEHQSHYSLIFFRTEQHVGYKHPVQRPHTSHYDSKLLVWLPSCHVSKALATARFCSSEQLNTFSRSDLCSAAISLPCTLIYVSYTRVAGMLGLAVWLPAMRATWTPSGCRAPISHRWHDYVMVCQISLPLSFQEVELFCCWHQSGLGRLCVCMNEFLVSVCLLLRNFIIRFFFCLHTGAFAWCALKAFTCVSARNVAKHWAFCPDLTY